MPTNEELRDNLLKSSHKWGPAAPRQFHPVIVQPPPAKKLDPDASQPKQSINSK